MKTPPETLPAAVMVVSLLPFPTVVHLHPWTGTVARMVYCRRKTLPTEGARPAEPRLPRRDARRGSGGPRSRPVPVARWWCARATTTASFRITALNSRPLWRVGIVVSLLMSRPAGGKLHEWIRLPLFLMEQIDGAELSGSYFLWRVRLGGSAN